MPKPWLLFIVFGFITVNCFGQNNKGITVFSVGPSFPVGDYRSKNLVHKPASFAKMGGSASLSYFSNRKKWLGFTAILQGQFNPLDTKALEAAAQTEIYEPAVGVGSGGTSPPQPSSFTRYPDWKFDKDEWLAASFLAGGYGEFLCHHSALSLVIRVMVGAMYAHSPALNGGSVTDTATAHYNQASKSGIGFTYLIDGGIKYRVSTAIWLYGQLEYNGTNSIKFKKIQTTLFTAHSSLANLPGSSASQTVTTMDGKQKISCINLSLGVGLRL